MLLVDKKDFLTDKDSLFISEEDSPNMPFVPNRKRQRNSSADSFSTHIVSKRGRIDSDSDNEEDHREVVKLYGEHSFKEHQRPRASICSAAG